MLRSALSRRSGAITKPRPEPRVPLPPDDAPPSLAAARAALCAWGPLTAQAADEDNEIQHRGEGEHATHHRQYQQHRGTGGLVCPGGLRSQHEANGCRGEDHQRGLKPCVP